MNDAAMLDLEDDLELLDEDDLPDLEDDFDAEDDLEDGLFAAEDVQAMEQLASLAAESLEDDDAEDAFVGALASIASKVLPMAKRALPILKRAGTALLNKAKRSPAVRNAVRTIPTIMRKTARDQLRRYASGRPVTVKSTLRSAAGHAARTMDDPARARQVAERSRAIAKRGRGTSRRGAPNPGGYRRVCRCRWQRV